jgi:hypothetical protein
MPLQSNLPEGAGRKTWEATSLRQAGGGVGSTISEGAQSLLHAVKPLRRRIFEPDQLTCLTQGQLYDQARALGVRGRSRMDKLELAEAIRRAHKRRGLTSFLERCRHGLAAASGWLMDLLASSGRLVAALPTAGVPRVRIGSAGSKIGNAKRIALLAAIVGLCGALGLLVAVFFVPDEGGSALVRRVQNGVTETGRVETVTTPGGVKRVIRWRTRQGKVVTETLRGPLRMTTLNGETLYLAGPSQTIVHTTTLSGGTVVVTVSGVTSIATVPVTVVETLPVTETVRDTVTDTVTEVVTEIVTVTAPGPPGP